MSQKARWKGIIFSQSVCSMIQANANIPYQGTIFSLERVISLAGSFSSSLI